MDEEMLPKKMFGELRKKRACHGLKRSWRDLVWLNFQCVGMKEDWYQIFQDWKEWFEHCCEGVDEVTFCRKRNTCTANRQSQERSFVCMCVCMCERSFWKWWPNQTQDVFVQARLANCLGLSQGLRYHGLKLWVASRCGTDVNTSSWWPW